MRCALDNAASMHKLLPADATRAHVKLFGFSPDAFRFFPLLLLSLSGNKNFSISPVG
jgi:hypothetical protein